MTAEPDITTSTVSPLMMRFLISAGGARMDCYLVLASALERAGELG